MDFHALSTLAGILCHIHASVMIVGMSEIEYAERFAAALVSEIKAEMGRQSLSSRGLGRLIGKSSQYMSDRLDGGNTKTGRRVILNVWDISAIAKALALTEVELIQRAEDVARRRNDYDLVANETINEFPAGDDADWDQA